jgi:hypothetical protein
MGGLYCWPLAVKLGDPIVNLSRYQARWWAGPSPVSVPLLPILLAADFATRPRSNIVRVGFSLFVVLAGFVSAVGSPTMRSWFAGRPGEAMFGVCYLLFILSYNSGNWAWGSSRGSRYQCSR